MTLTNTEKAMPAGTYRRRVATWLIFALALLMTSATAASAAGHKVAPDLENFPRHSDGTVDVIIQFTEKPGAKHFADVAAQGGRLKHSLEHIKGGAFNVPASLLPWLEKNPHIAYVTPDRPNQASQATYENETPAVMADVARQQYAFDGTGVGVAIIDSGVYNHDDLQTSNGTASRIVYSASFVPGDSTTNDAYGHGTHVAGLVAGNGQDSQWGYSRQFSGLAPNANIINLRVLDANGVSTDSEVIAAIESAIQLQSTYNIRVINLSLGRPVFESYTQDPLCQAVEAAWQAGIVVVVAAGNDGRDNTNGNDGYATIGAPGNDPYVITVGATKTNGTPTRLDDYVASYSSKGPTLLDHVVKPDLVAPGNRLVSLEAPGSTLAVNFPSFDVVSQGGTTSQYLELSGTSMATPVVAGAAALMIQSDPTLTPDTVKARMMKTAWKGYPSNSWAYDSWGRGYLSQYDVFTIGAGYLDVDAVLGNTDVANGSAASPVASFNSSNGQVTISNLPSGTSIIWGHSIIWGNSIVWGNNAILNDSIIWGNSVVWGDDTLSGNSIIWGQSIIWQSASVGALSTGEDGEN